MPETATRPGTGRLKEIELRCPTTRKLCGKLIVYPGIADQPGAFVQIACRGCKRRHRWSSITGKLRR